LELYGLVPQWHWLWFEDKERLMSSTEPFPQEIDTTFTAPMSRDESIGGWTIVLMPGSCEFFGTRKPVKVAGTIDGHAFAATMLPMGDGIHMIPIKAALRKSVGKEHGADVTVRLERRFS
jgi:hypothetical protein